MALPAWLSTVNPVWLALIATCFTWGVTALGAAMVFLFKTVDRRVLDAMLGFAAGVMIAASFWSLLAPAIDMAKESGNSGWFQAAAGFLLGGLFVAAIDKVLPHLHLGLPKSQAEGIKTQWQRS
ncbi:MAG: ZIP family metal transporter, partial [Caldilineaceae bacterium]|nr:ZIP family metal transporter [Caldilinea sp.]MCB0151297.1 ZIP family metal transporter [Caldilineaceae bacterium]